MSLDALVREHLPATLRFAERLTGDPHRAEDLVQEALLRVSRSWLGFRRQSGFRTWLFRIVINAFRDQLARLPEPSGLDPCEVPDRGFVDPAQIASWNEQEQMIHDRIQNLPPRQREVMVLHVHERLSTHEIAQIVGIRESNVYATLHVARHALEQNGKLRI